MLKEKNYSTVVESPVGYLGLQLVGKTLVGIDFLGKRLPSSIKDCLNSISKESVKNIQSALDAYFNNPKKVMPPGTQVTGSDFQKKVWHLLTMIKPGQTRTYGDIAKEINSSPRAVGNACRSNPIPIFIPCHRVVSATGRGGFMGRTSGEAMDIKEWLLAHEQKTTEI